MTDGIEDVPPIPRTYGSLASMLRKYDRFARQSRFLGAAAGEFEKWQADTRLLLHHLLGLDKMEAVPLDPVCTESVPLPDGIIRERWVIQTEPDVSMPFYLLIPPGADERTRPFLCPPGHGGAGKYTVAGLSAYRAVAERIALYNYECESRVDIAKEEGKGNPPKDMN